MKKLTEKQENILEFIETYIDERGYPPSVREIGKAVGLSSSASVHSHLTKLEEKGFIHKDPSTSRGIIIVKDEDPTLDSVSPISDYINVPNLGLVTAGNPIEAIEQVTDYFPIPASIVKSNDPVFMLTVSGESMKDVGIKDRDQILVQKTTIAKNGEIVVAMTLDNEATVKTFYQEQGQIRLQPENDAYEPIILKEQECQVIGKVIGLFRNIH